jgi:hypothetical protein
MSAGPAIYTPPISSHHRELFERAYREGDDRTAALSSIGGLIEVMRSRLSSFHNTEDPAATVTLYEDRYQTALKERLAGQTRLLAKSRQGSEADVGRANLYNALVDQLVLLPALQGSDHTSRQLRAELIDGSYGLIGSVMETVYRRYKRQHNELELNHSVGFLNELTALGLANRPQSPDRFALQALPCEDADHETDLWTYQQKESGDFRIRGWQVKSSEWLRKWSRNRVIGGIALGNSRKSTIWPGQELFQTVLAMLHELDGQASETEASTLDKLSHALSIAIGNDASFIAPPGQGESGLFSKLR